MIEFFLFFVISSFAEETPIYSDPFSPIYTDKEVYSWTDKVKITIVAPSWNANRFGIDSIGIDEGHFIKISTSENSLEPYKLTETEPSSGVFTGEVILTGFLHDVDGDGRIDTNPRTMGSGPTGGFLETDRDEGLTISFEFADGVVLTQSALIRWNIGEIFFNEPQYSVGETSKILVTDPDMNLNPEAVDRVNVEVSSDSDVAGIIVEAIETSEDSGLFEASILFTQTQTSSGNRLFAFPGESLQAKYEDYTLPKPYSIEDNLEITSKSKLVSDIPSLERISISNNFIGDSSGNEIIQPSKDEQLQLVGSIQNNQNYKQDFVFILQITNSQGTVVSISWVQGKLEPNQNLELSQSWNPKDSGNYLVESYVWSSLTEPIPLSPIFSKSYFIQ